MQVSFVKASRKIVGRVGMSFLAVTGVAGTRRGLTEEKGWRPWFGLLFLKKRRTMPHRETRPTEIRMTLKRRIVLTPSWQIQIRTYSPRSMNKD